MTDHQNSWEEQQKRVEIEFDARINYLFRLILNNNFMQFKKEFLEQKINPNHEFQDNRTSTPAIRLLDFCLKADVPTKFHEFLIKAGAKIDENNINLILKIKDESTWKIYLKNISTEQLEKETKKKHLILNRIMGAFAKSGYNDKRELDLFFSKIDKNIRTENFDSLFDVVLAASENHYNLTNIFIEEYFLETVEKILPTIFEFGLNPFFKNNDGETVMDIFKERYDYISKQNKKNKDEEKQLKLLASIIKGLEIYQNKWLIENNISSAPKNKTLKI